MTKKIDWELRFFGLYRTVTPLGIYTIRLAPMGKWHVWAPHQQASVAFSYDLDRAKELANERIAKDMKELQT